jgi:hypothetical protein
MGCGLSSHCTMHPSFPSTNFPPAMMALLAKHAPSAVRCASATARVHCPARDASNTVPCLSSISSACLATNASSHSCWGPPASSMAKAAWLSTS